MLVIEHAKVKDPYQRTYFEGLVQDSLSEAGLSLAGFNLFSSVDDDQLI